VHSESTKTHSFSFSLNKYKVMANLALSFWGKERIDYVNILKSMLSKLHVNQG